MLEQGLSFSKNDMTEPEVASNIPLRQPKTPHFSQGLGFGLIGPLIHFRRLLEDFNALHHEATSTKRCYTLHHGSHL